MGDEISHPRDRHSENTHPIGVKIFSRPDNDGYRRPDFPKELTADVADQNATCHSGLSPPCMPDQALRLQYLQWALDGMSHSVLQEVAGKTHGWSFAYLNELRISARILAIDNRRTCAAAHDVHSAFNLLNRQFGACKRGHEDSASRSNMGFKATP